MNTASALVLAVRAAGVEITTDGASLHLRGARPLPRDLLDALRAAKPQVIATLANVALRASPDEAAHSFAERAAIAEFDGELPRAWAEGLAWLCVMPCPAAYTPQRWARLIDDAARFADRWAAKAAGLGWTALDVFGVHRQAPEARPDGKGLVPILDGAEVIAIAPDTAKIRTRAGAIQTYYRRPCAEAVAVWEVTDNGRC